MCAGGGGGAFIRHERSPSSYVLLLNYQCVMFGNAMVTFVSLSLWNAHTEALRAHTASSAQALYQVTIERPTSLTFHLAVPYCIFIIIAL